MSSDNWLEFCNGLATLPGVYIMRDGAGVVIYIGKAKNLRARIKQYFQGHDERYQIEFLVKKIAKIETVVTKTERQAFLLERDLINKHKPRYNVRLKDDKSYLSVRIDMDAEWPRIDLTRRVEADGALYFGPYTEAQQLYSLLDLIKKTVPLRNCSDTVFYNRQRPCLEYQLKRCVAPCCLAVERADYIVLVKQAIKILEGKNEELIEELQKRMQKASDELRFEEAASLRDRLKVLEDMQGNEVAKAHHAESRDIFGLYREGANLAVSILFFRNGYVVGNRNFSFAQVAENDLEILESVITNFYQKNRDLPLEIVLPVQLENSDLLSDILSEQRGRKVELTVPERGAKLQLVKLAEINASEHFKTIFYTQEKTAGTLKELAKLFGLSQVPRRIECVDISNFQGSDIVSGITSFFDGQPDKKRYKHFKLGFREKPDDFACIYEVVSRHIKRGMQEQLLPDLLLIDGGKGQLDAALKARDDLRATLEIASLAKERTKSAFKEKNIELKPERIFVENQADSIALDEQSEVTQLLKRIRDETHRFAITFHRKTRAKRVFKSALDDVSGLGPARRTRLLKAFGSVETIKGLEAEEIAQAGRMPLALAQRVLSVLSNS